MQVRANSTKLADLMAKPEKKNESPDKLRTHNKIAWSKRALLVLVGLSFILAAELVLRLLSASTQDSFQRDPFVGFSSVNPLFVQYVADDSTVRMKTSADKLNWFNEQDFPLRKNANTFRIFSLGGSTTYGRPYTDPTSFSGWLRALLNPDGNSGREYEVINAGGISYASYRVHVVLEELLSYSPDLFIIYTGHNEFLETRTYGNLQDQSSLIFKTRKMLSGMALYKLLNNTIKSPNSSKNDNNQQRAILGPEVRTMLDSSAGLDLYERDTLFSKGVFDHFRYNIQQIKSLCKQAGVPLVFLKPVDNIKDFSPFKSQPDATLSEENKERLARLASEAARHLQTNELQAAISKLTEAVGIDSLYADHWFLLGRAYLAAADTASAAACLFKARELDVCPLRAQSPIHRILGEEMVGADDPPLLDLPEMFKQIAPGGLIGQELLIDHIHPLPEGNLRIALFILEWMTDSGLADKKLNPTTESQLIDFTSSVFSSLPEDYALNGIVKLARVLYWAKKYNEALGALEEQWELLKGTARAQYLRGELMLALGYNGLAIENFRNAYELEPEEKIITIMLAGLYSKASMTDSAEVLLERGIERFPDDARILGDYGMLLAGKGKTEIALRALLKAQHMEPDNENIQLNICNTYAMNGMLPRAVKAYQKFIENYPFNSDAWYNLANVHFQLNDTEKAEEHYLKAIDLNRQNALAQLNLGNLYAGMDRDQLAESYYKMAMESDPSLRIAYDNLAILYKKMGQDSLAASITSDRPR